MNNLVATGGGKFRPRDMSEIIESVLLGLKLDFLNLLLSSLSVINSY